jgi:hypothetical protein
MDDIRQLDEPYRSALRSFVGERSMKTALEQELRERGGGYRFLRGIWLGEFGTPPELTE